MFRLIRLDLGLNRNVFCIFTPLITAYLVYMSHNETSLVAYTIFATLLSALIPLTIMAREDKYHATSFICSLPATRRQLVNAKYVQSWVLSLVYGLMAVSLYAIFGPLSWLEVWGPATTGLFLVLLTIALGAMQPFILRFGRTGFLVALVIPQILGILVFLLINVFTPQMTLRDHVGRLSQQIGDLYLQAGTGLFFTVLIAVLIALSYGSYALSITLFKRREL